jgi:HEPN domain-containing protein
MADITRQIAYWKDGAVKDLAFAGRLLNRDGEVLYGLFFVHLTLEKIIKSHVCKQTSEIPPRTHNLLTLAKLGKLILTQEQSDFLGKMNLYNIQGRYPGMEFPSPTLESAKLYLERAKEITEWLINQL